MFNLNGLDQYKIQQKSWGKRGSTTVELSLILPLIILTLIVIIYIVILLYQVAYHQSLINNVTKAASRNWGRITANHDVSSLIKTGRVEIEHYQEPLYWRITLLDDTSRKERWIKEHIEASLNDKSAVKSKNNQITVKYRDQILYRELTTEALVTYQLPLPLLKHVLGVGKGYTVKVSSKAIVKDPAETIRTIDLIGDLMDESEITKNIKDKYNEILTEAKEKIGELFD